MSSTLRAAAQKALEAMDNLHRTGDTQVFDLCHRETTEALRAALAEPEPATQPGPGLVMRPECCSQFAPPQRKPLRTVTYVCPVCAASLERQE